VRSGLCGRGVACGLRRSGGGLVCATGVQLRMIAKKGSGVIGFAWGRPGSSRCGRRRAIGDRGVRRRNSACWRQARGRGRGSGRCRQEREVAGMPLTARRRVWAAIRVRVRVLGPSWGSGALEGHLQAGGGGSCGGRSVALCGAVSGRLGVWAGAGAETLSWGVYGAVAAGSGAGSAGSGRGGSWGSGSGGGVPGRGPAGPGEVRSASQSEGGGGGVRAALHHAPGLPAVPGAGAPPGGGPRGRDRKTGTPENNQRTIRFPQYQRTIRRRQA
jgi:hypothetical protein